MTKKGIDYSKTIRKAEDPAKRLMIELLEGKDGHGIDIDVLFYHEHYGWTVVEFLKCDTVKPTRSHPNRYWFKNWRKFVTLWEVTKKLDGKLFLVNYSDDKSDRSLIIEVLELEKDNGITKQRCKSLNWQELKRWYQDINDSVGHLW